MQQKRQETTQQNWSSAGISLNVEHWHWAKVRQRVPQICISKCQAELNVVEWNYSRDECILSLESAKRATQKFNIEETFKWRSLIYWEENLGVKDRKDKRKHRLMQETERPIVGENSKLSYL